MKPAKIVFIFSCGFLLYCALAWLFKWPPYPQVADSLYEIRLLMSGGSAPQEGNGKKPPHLFPLRYHNYGATTHDAATLAPGVTLLTTYWPDYEWRNGIRLIDAEGKTLHHWNIDPKALFPFKNIPKNTYVHGSYLFPNGDVLFNIEYAGLVRMNACGEVLWTIERQTHHSVFRDEQGNFRVSGYRKVPAGSERAKQFVPIRRPFGEDTLLTISPQGEILQEISLLEALYNSDYKHLLWHYDRVKSPWQGDVLHLNDIEVLGTERAEEFPGFVAGDVVISAKFINTVAVLSAEGKIKWLTSQTFTHQHDPDFESGGWITVFDNRTDGSHDGRYLGGTQIKSIHPSSGETRILYPPPGAAPIYTGAGGKHQLLDNGNRLITEAQAGRVLEVSAESDLVWEWVNSPYSEGGEESEFVAEILEGTRYNLDPETINGWNCSR